MPLNCGIHISCSAWQFGSGYPFSTKVPVPPLSRLWDMHQRSKKHEKRGNFVLVSHVLENRIKGSFLVQNFAKFRERGIFLNQLSALGRQL